MICRWMVQICVMRLGDGEMMDRCVLIKYSVVRLGDEYDRCEVMRMCECQIGLAVVR